MLENKLQKPKNSTLFSIRRAAGYVPISALALLSLAPAVSGCARTDLTRIGLSQTDTTTLFFQIEQAKKDFSAYTRNPSDETLQTAYSSAQSAYEFLSQRGLHKTNTPSIAELVDLYLLTGRLITVNRNNESKLEDLLVLFDDESFRKEFISTYGSSPFESGGYVRIKNGSLLITREQQQGLLDEYLGYVNDFKEGNYKRAQQYIDFVKSLIEKDKNFIDEREAGLINKLLGEFKKYVPYIEALHRFVEYPDKAMELYKGNEPLQQFLRELEPDKAKQAVQELKSDITLMEKLMTHGMVLVLGLMELGDVKDVIGTWHNHTYNTLSERLDEGKPAPPSTKDLRNSIYNGHSFVFSFGATQLEVYRLKYGKEELLLIYDIDPPLKPALIPDLILPPKQTPLPQPLPF